jgi:dTDP-4-amino-4,6-dideoxygalactose transaminase
MENKKIWLSSPHMGGSEQKYVQEAFDDNWIAPLGPHVNAVEENLAQYIGQNRQVAALNTGTSAIHLALIQSGVSPGDTVICSSFTFTASANPIVYLGAEPVFVDSESTTWNISPTLLEEAITTLIAEEKKPKAILIVHLYGISAQMDKITTIAKKYNITLIEDAAEALGSTYKNQTVGTFGDFGVFSFNGNKIITGSAGGALVSKTKEAAQQSRFLSTQAKEALPHFEHKEIGYNYRMSNICAGIIRGQLEVLDEHIALRRGFHFKYREAFKDIEAINFLVEPNKDFFSNHWLTCFTLDSSKTKLTNEDIRLHLDSLNIESRNLWKPMHLQPVYKTARSFVDGTSENIFNIGLCLPSGSNMTDEEFARVIEGIKSIF